MSICWFVCKTEGTLFRVHFIVILSHHFAIIVTPTLRAAIWLAEIICPNLWRVLGAQEKFESALCSVRMKELVFWGENSYSFLLFYNPWLVCMCI